MNDPRILRLEPSEYFEVPRGERAREPAMEVHAIGTEDLGRTWLYRGVKIKKDGTPGLVIEGRSYIRDAQSVPAKYRARLTASIIDGLQADIDAVRGVRIDALNELIIEGEQS